MQNKTQQTEPGVRADTAEANRLYQRGVAAARAGQKRIAVGCLTKSVQLDPQNEGAWLWLSGVVDDPDQTAFCLKSVLKLNPNNERARRGLQWLEQRHTLKTDAATTFPSVESAVYTSPADQTNGRKPQSEQHDSWWIHWRHGWRDSQMSRLLIWTIPIVVLLLVFGIYRAVTYAVEQSDNPQPVVTNPEPTSGPATALLAPLSPDEIVLPEEEDVIMGTQVLDAEGSGVRESQAIAYLDQLAELRSALNTAVDNYRSITGSPGATMTHLAAAQDLNKTVLASYELMQTMTPPPDLREAHNEYILGLEEELAGIADLLEFYGTYRMEMANRAVVRFQNANAHFERARMMFDLRLQQIGADSEVSVHTIR